MFHSIISAEILTICKQHLRTINCFSKVHSQVKNEVPVLNIITASIRIIFHHSEDFLKSYYQKDIIRYVHVVEDRSSHQRCSVTKGVHRSFAKFTGKHLCQSLLFNMVAGPRPANLLKKRLWYGCFPVHLVKFLRTPFSQNTSGALLL